MLSVPSAFLAFSNRKRTMTDSDMGHLAFGLLCSASFQFRMYNYG